MNQMQTLDKAPAEKVHVLQAASEAAEAIVDLRGILLTIWHRKWIIVICAFISAVLAMLVVAQFEPRYKASAKVMFDIQKTNVVDLQQVLVDQEFSKDTLQNEIEVLRSTKLIQRVIADLDLAKNPEFNPNLVPPRETALDRLRATFSMPPEIVRFMRSTGLKQPLPPPPDEVEAKRRELLSIVGNVQNGLALAPVRGSRVIRISFTASDPRVAARIVNSMADQYIVDQLDAKLDTARAATDWLSDRVAMLQDRVETAENAVEAARTRLAVEGGQGIEITNQQLETLNGSLALARNELAARSAQFARLSDAVAAGLDMGAVPEFRNSSLIQSFRQNRSELEARLLRLRASVPEGHPSIQRLDEQLGEVQRNIDEEAERIVAALSIELQSAKSQESSLVAEVRALETKALSQSSAYVELRQLEREANASRTLYENFLSRQQETSAQEDLQNADARVLSPAEPPLYPQSERKRLIVIASTVLGTFAGLCLIFLLERLNNTFRAPTHISELTGLGVLATVPGVGSRMKRSSVIGNLRDKPNGALAESVRNLRTSILFSNLDDPPKVVMFTSSVPREGKSTTSMMMAMTSRQMGKSAIIVDCDLRMPALAKLLEAGDTQPGLLSVMEGSAEVKDAVFVEQESGLHVLMAKANERPAQINPADILASQKFKSLIAALSEHYDLVILDTPPTLVVTDARIVSQIADAVVYAVRWDHTPRGAVIEGLSELKSVDAPMTGVVLTMVNEARAGKYAYDGYSYYKGRYRDYYEA